MYNRPHSTSVLHRRGLTLALGLVLVMAAAVVLTPAAAAQEPIADLAISKSASPEPVANGGELTYTIVVSNIGDAPAGTVSEPVEVFDIYPSEFTLESFEITPVGSCVAAFAQLECQITTLDPGESATITASGTISTPGDDLVTNQALVDLPISRIDESSDTLNNIARAESTVLDVLPVGGVSREVAAGALPGGSAGSNGVAIAVVTALVVASTALAGGVLYARRR
ncbi:MAG: CARDB domain-containing protein [Dehalococcoidia bacterium]